jgi:hypothetical protein
MEVSGAMLPQTFAGGNWTIENPGEAKSGRGKIRVGENR